MDTPAPLALRRCLGPVAVTAQAVATIGLTLTAVINIPQATLVAGHSTVLSYGLALVTILLVCETLVLFRHHPGDASGIAGYVRQGLGAKAGALASWALLLGYGATMLACLAFFGFYLDHLAAHLHLPVVPAAGFLVGGLGCLELARRDVRLSTKAMLSTESLSVLIVLALCLLLLKQAGPVADLQALNPAGDTPVQVRSGLMIAVLSFIGFESAANLGGEAMHPERDVPRAMRIAVLLAGGLFLFWAMVLPMGLAWLPAAARSGLDPISLVADRLGQPGAGDWIKAGAFLCLFGSTLGSLTALGRVAFGLAKAQVLPAPLAAVHPRFGTPSTALVAAGLPLIALGVVLVARGMGANQIYDLLGGFSVLGFLLVYGLVAATSLGSALQGVSRFRRMLIGWSCLVAVGAVAIGYLSSALEQEGAMVFSFVALMGLGALLVSRTLAKAPNPA